MLLKNSKLSIERLLSKITFIHQAAGLQFFSVNKESLDPTGGISRKHKLFLVLSFSIVIGEICGCFILTYFDNSLAVDTGVKTGVMVQLIAASSVLFLILVSTLNNLFLKGRAKEIFKNCFRIADLLSLLNEVADYSLFAKGMKLTMVKLFFGFIVSNMAVLIVSYQYSEGRFWMSGVLAIYPHFFITSLVSYWILLVRLIRENLRFIKGCLVHLNKKQKTLSLCSEPYNRDLRIRKAEETYDFIVKLKRMHAITYDSISLVNELIGIPICFFMVFVVLSNISGGYKVFLAFKGDILFERVAGKKTKKKLLVYHLL